MMPNNEHGNGKLFYSLNSGQNIPIYICMFIVLFQEQNDWSIKFTELEKSTEKENITNQNDNAATSITKETPSTLNSVKKNGRRKISKGILAENCDIDVNELRDQESQKSNSSISDIDDESESKSQVEHTNIFPKNPIKIYNVSLTASRQSSGTQELPEVDRNMVRRYIFLKQRTYLHNEWR